MAASTIRNLLLCVCILAKPTRGTVTFHMNNFIDVLEELETHLAASSMLAVIELLQELGDCASDDFHRYVLGRPSAPELNLPSQAKEQKSLIRLLMKHEVGPSTENGVVLVPDGTTVALCPLISGLEAGLKRNRDVPLPDVKEVVDHFESLTLKDGVSSSTVDNLYSATIAKDLGLAFFEFQENKTQTAMGPDGCWDDVSMPRVFTLLGDPSPVTNAFVNGALDGIILGHYISEGSKVRTPRRISTLGSKVGTPSRISTLLKDYYNNDGVAADMTLRSNFRRKNFLKITSLEKLEKTVKISLILYRTIMNISFPGSEDKEEGNLASNAVQEFHQFFLECPAIIPRCMWGARPFKGTPTLLTLPLEFLYIHHTYEPSRPCTTFPACSADMRSMQQFHQKDRGWSDIGYSFVVGSDGYLYEGRGWYWLGAHTRGHNTRGYGVSFIGNYTATLPEAFSLELVRDNFQKCAVRGGKLISTFSIQGHRQVVATSCPGDALFAEIKTWNRFKET
uniref:N-acetylmuramoyl-L-alanine amidase isoform X2 n=1 Tax=Geotrypetes seraphini TaxID=260995 RepID=A0A6P8PDZ3_GEOSA|nr:N-acetylmuramoyl-L-alanine amidase isoform X2 [Geotrypetes seraphini]XP_033779356.1 N-acetylmuramoyl-L-alanine amidase isoform X2 [Geotrypetes seraphini]XP_033779357.1 N-acetylmuramoyl-L-alanine amidase isoform X2 [Geotrypetes seraphini]XP_033779358.1 N-acetylmuramoyl-L-alanine amidase isoform X2 [Geotrypetes seraphini]